MAGGLIQLVAYGIEDMFLTTDPQITFFKITYRRHTIFATETAIQRFKHLPDFGGRYSCVLAKDGDLVDDLALKIVLPELPKFQVANGIDILTKVAWVRQIGHALLKSVEIEINGQVVDRHYGEWMHLWNMLTSPCKDSKGIDKLIGNIPEMYEYTNGKPEYTLFIPLYFWFCRHTGLALPLTALQYSDVKLNIELNDFNKCILVTPTDYIKCTDALVNFKQFEYIYQRGVDGTDRFGMFTDYDIIEKKLYYSVIGAHKLTGIPYDGVTLTETARKNLIDGTSYIITGMSTKFVARPEIETKSVTYLYRGLKNIHLKDVAVMVDYVYLNDEERKKMAMLTHDYIIEQLYFSPSQYIENTNRSIKIISDQPCKLLVWVAQFEYIEKSNDQFNYTDSHVRKTMFDTDYISLNSGDLVGKSLIDKETLLLNSTERLNSSNHAYHELVQPFQHTKNTLPTGAGMYSFALLPTDIQPSGTTNMSQIEMAELAMKMNFKINPTAKAKVRAYALCYNIWRVNNGLSGTLFVKNS